MTKKEFLKNIAGAEYVLICTSKGKDDVIVDKKQIPTYLELDKIQDDEELSSLSYEIVNLVEDDHDELIEKIYESTINEQCLEGCEHIRVEVIEELIDENELYVGTSSIYTCPVEFVKDGVSLVKDTNPRPFGEIN